MSRKEPTPTGVKICGLKRPEDIRTVNELRPDYCGFIIDFPKSHRSRTPDEVRALTALLNRDAVIPVGVFVDAPPELPAALLREGTVAMAQLHGSENEDYIRRLQDAAGMPVIKAFQVTGADTLLQALRSPADYILLDRGQGSGMTFDWSLAEELREELSRRSWFLAGGLNETNITEAIRRLHPTAVDLSGAVETGGFKDREKVKKIIDAVRRTAL